MSYIWYYFLNIVTSNSLGSSKIFSHLVNDKVNMNIVDLSGYSFTGKSAVHDLISKCGYYSCGKEFEFDLIRVQGGLLDLRQALTQENWSPVRSSEAVRNFLRLVHHMGGDKSLISRLRRSGAHYDYYLPGFSQLTNEFVALLVEASWQCEWPFALYSRDKEALTAIKLARKFGFSREDTVYLARLSKAEFDAKCREYFERLFAPIAAKGFRWLVLNNAFEPFSPERSIEFFDHAKAIVVDRDPRDVYISALRAGKIAGSQVGLAVTGGSVSNFIHRFRIYRSGATLLSPHVYRMKFESLVLDYEAELIRIRTFLGDPSVATSSQGRAFDPVNSVRNVGQWKRLDDLLLLDDVAVIKSELSEYCLDL